MPRSHALVYGLLLAVTLAACSSDPEPVTLPPVISQGSPSLVGTPTPTTSPVADIASSIARPQDQRTPDGASAFVRYYFAVYDASAASGSVSTLVSISDPTCKTCALYVKRVDSVREAGGTQRGAATTVVEALTPGSQLDYPLVDVRVTTAAGRIEFTNGSSQELPAAANNFDMQLMWANDRWIAFRIIT